MEIHFLYKLYLFVHRKSWRWAPLAEIAHEIEVWGDETDVCLYVSPVVRRGEEYFFLPIIDLDCKKSPDLALFYALSLFSEKEKELFIPVLSGKKGLKLVSKFLLPLELVSAFRVWLLKKWEGLREEVGAALDAVQLDLSTFPRDLKIATPPQPVRLWGWRGKSNGGDYVAARPVSWTKLAKIAFQGGDAYKEAVSTRPSAADIAKWTRLWVRSLGLAPNWLIEELEKIIKELEEEKKVAACVPRVGFPESPVGEVGAGWLERVAEVAAELEARGHNIALKENYRIIFRSECPACGRKHKAWVDAKGRLRCFSPSCEAYVSLGGLPLGKWLQLVGLEGWEEKFSREIFEEEKKNFVPLRQGEEIVEETVTKFFKEGKNAIFAVSPGVGKTHVSLDAAIKAAKEGKTVIFAVENYGLAEEFYKSFSGRARLSGVLFQVLRSRYRDKYCERLEDVEKAEKNGFYPAHVVCPYCQHRQDCRFWAQFQKSFARGAIFLCTHDFLGVAVSYLRKAGWKDIHVIVDDPHESRFVKEFSFSFSYIEDFAETFQEYFPSLKGIVKAFRRAEKKIRKALLRKNEKEGRVYLAPPVVGPWAGAPSLEGLLGKELPFGDLILEIESFLGEFNSQGQRYRFFQEKGIGSESILLFLREIARKGYVFLHVKKGKEAAVRSLSVRKIEESKILVLTATPEPDALKKIFPALGGGEVVKVGVPGLEKAIRVQIANTYSKFSFSKKRNSLFPGLVEALRQIKKAWPKKGVLKVFVLTHKKNKKMAVGLVRQAARRAKVKIQTFSSLHHFNCRGSNVAKDCDVLIQFGSPVLPPSKAWDLASVFGVGPEYVENLAKREAFQEAHRLRPVRAGLGEKAIIYVGTRWPYSVAPELVLKTEGRPRKGEKYAPVRIRKIETAYPVLDWLEKGRLPDEGKVFFAVISEKKKASLLEEKNTKKRGPPVFSRSENFWGASYAV